MTDELRPGLEATHRFVADGPLLTDVGGTLGFSVLSTPGMIAMMERTAAMLVHPLLREGEASVGFEVCIKHVRGAPAGTELAARATLEAVEGRKLRFAVEVTDAAGATIGVGRHERRVIRSARGAR